MLAGSASAPLALARVEQNGLTKRVAPPLVGLAELVVELLDAEHGFDGSLIEDFPLNRPL